MSPVYCIATNITSPLGLSSGSVWDAVQAGESGVRFIEDDTLFSRPIWASAFSAEQWANIDEHAQQQGSPFERMAAYSARDAIGRCGEIDLSKTLLVLTTTKGNIEWLGQKPDERNRITTSAALVAQACGISSRPTVVSHACVSGVTGLIYGMRALQSGRFENVVVTGADRLSAFVISGFASFQALADGPCKPFDANRNGINLGEAAATIILSAKKRPQALAELKGGATSNDANHISGPSRTGDELAMAVNKALMESNLSAADIQAISAHGTATIYNDEMESKAFAQSGLLHAPLHSVKGYLGHTLGAAGVVESALLIESMRRGITIPSLGFEKPGVSQPVLVSTQVERREIRHALKTASGFGGCNAAVVWSKA